MTSSKTQSPWRVVAGSVPIVFAAFALAADVPRAPGDRSVVRVAPEISTAGVSVEEYFDRQAELHASLIADVPDATRATAIRVQLTEQELKDVELAVPAGPGPLRIGLVKQVAPVVQFSNLSGKNGVRGRRPAPAGTVRGTEDGGFVWAATVSSDGAGAVRVHFSDVSLPDNASLYFFSPGGEAYGPYRGRGPNGDGEFWSHSVLGSSGVIVLRISGPATLKDLQRASFTITHVGHIGSGFAGAVAAAGFCGNAPCIEDASCHNGTPAEAAKDAVAEMEWIAGAWIYTCTGGLIADTDPNSEIPYFLTANHCISKAKDAKNLECFFFYATSSCNGACPNNNNSPKTMGASIKATGRNGDFTLLELRQTPPSGTVFLGWNNAPVAFTDGADLYRISHPNFGPQVFSQHQVDASAPTCSGWPRGERIYSTDVVGATDGGSSGSPVVNAAGEIVGQLSGCCGYNCADVCDSASNSTVDGALAFYWDQVASFLDPTPCDPVAEVCDDGVDNDCDDLVDCADADCTGDPACPGCTLGQRGDPCSSGADCCSGHCKRNGTCR